MKRAIYAAVVLCLAAATLTGCNLIDAISRVYVDKWANLVNEKKYDAEINGNTIKYGDHSYTLDGAIDYDFAPGDYRQAVTASVTFTNIPSGYTEFKAIYEGLLGKSIAGTVSMVPMAMEIYARNSTTGERCLSLICKDEAKVNEIIRSLQNKIIPTTANGANDTYLQRYLPAALLKGADYENAYTPREPYTIEMGPAPTLPQEAKLTPYGTTFYTYIFADGWETRARAVDVFLPKGESYYKIQLCGSCYVQCREIFGGPWNGLK